MLRDQTTARWTMLGAATMAVGITACDVVQHTQTKTTPEFVISVTAGHQPFMAGEKVDLYVTLRKDRGPMSGCRVRLDHGAGGNAESTDGWLEFGEQGRSGVYRATLTIAPTPGAWQPEVAVKCLGREQRVPFDFDVAVSSDNS